MRGSKKLAKNLKTLNEKFRGKLSRDMGQMNSSGVMSDFRKKKLYLENDISFFKSLERRYYEQGYLGEARKACNF